MNEWIYFQHRYKSYIKCHEHRSTSIILHIVISPMAMDSVKPSYVFQYLTWFARAASYRELLILVLKIICLVMCPPLAPVGLHDCESKRWGSNLCFLVNIHGTFCLTTYVNAFFKYEKLLGILHNKLAIFVASLVFLFCCCVYLD